MPRTIRFHLDEHVDSAIAQGLRRRGIDVTTTVEANLLGASDDRHLAYALSEKRAIVTFDSDFLATAQCGERHSGITYRFQGNSHIGHVIRSLELIWELLEADEMMNRVEYL
jgi:predicted nuclease of predicted toxin-antitoxin system